MFEISAVLWVHFLGQQLCNAVARGAPTPAKIKPGVVLRGFSMKLRGRCSRRDSFGPKGPSREDLAGSHG